MSYGFSKGNRTYGGAGGFQRDPNLFSSLKKYVNRNSAVIRAVAEYLPYDLLISHGKGGTTPEKRLSSTLRPEMDVRLFQLMINSLRFLVFKTIMYNRHTKLSLSLNFFIMGIKRYCHLNA